MVIPENIKDILDENGLERIHKGKEIVNTLKMKKIEYLLHAMKEQPYHLLIQG